MLIDQEVWENEVGWKRQGRVGKEQNMMVKRVSPLTSSPESGRISDLDIVVSRQK